VTSGPGRRWVARCGAGRAAPGAGRQHGTGAGSVGLTSVVGGQQVNVGGRGPSSTNVDRAETAAGQPHGFGRRRGGCWRRAAGRRPSK
jgi:hypothetical protein